MNPETISLSVRDARRLFLHRQGLLQRSQFGRGREGAGRAISQLSHLQIDTISVVERAHHHILRSRIPNYRTAMLHDLQVRDRHLFEYWAHAAAYLPIRDYRYCLPVMEGSAIKRRPDAKLAPRILDRIRAEGPLQSRHFENDSSHRSSGWWDWKPAKRALEQLFLCGELMVVARNGFQKIYDLRENVLPTDLDTSKPTDKEWCEFLINRQIGALALATEYDIGYMRTAIRQLADRNLRHEMAEALVEMVEQGTVIPVEVAGVRYYAHPETLSLLPLRLGARRVTVLSPFDNAVINRKRTLALFAFDYQLECYFPPEKRQYGYFALPLLYGDQLIGRMDAKAVRKEKSLAVNNLVLDPHVKVDERLEAALAVGIRQFATDNDCDEIRILRRSPAGLHLPL